MRLQDLTPRIAAVLVAGLALIPIAGLLLGLFGRAASPSPFLAPDSLTLAEQLGRSGAPALAAKTLFLALAVGGLALALGTALAWLEQRQKYPGGRLLSSLALLPLAIPSYLLAGTLREALGPGGSVGQPLGLPVFTGLGPAVLVLTLVCTPYVQVLVGAALARMSVAEEEAARNLGAGAWRCFHSVVLPRLRPALAGSGLLVVLYVVSDFGAVAVLDCPVLTWRIFQAYETQDLPRAVILGLSSLGLIVPFLVVGNLAQRGATVPDVANPRTAERRRPTSWGMAGAYALHLPVVVLGFVLPVLSLAGWVWRGWSHGEPFAGVGKPLLQTLALAGIGAVVVVLLAWMPSWVSARRGAGWGWFIDQSVYLAGALPGVLVATGLILAALSLQRAGGSDGIYLGLRQWGLLLFAGYGTRYLAQGFSGLKSTFLRLDPRQEESARSLGAGTWSRLSRVVLPSAAPGIAAAYLLLFLVLIKELPITLMLQPIGVQTLSFRVFDRYREAFLHDAGLAGAVLVIVALGGQLATLRWRRHV